MNLEDVKKLVSLANKLDTKGLYKEASIIDQAILKLSQEISYSDAITVDRGQIKESDIELHVYDFDATLFRSPHSPAIYKGTDWWSSLDSLTEPAVPSRPDESWWIPETVGAAKKSISNPNVFSILLTGRKDNSAFRYRVPELLAMAGLDFDRVELANSEDALEWKIKTVYDYIRILTAQGKKVSKICFWDDRPSHLSSFKSTFERLGYDVDTTQVSAESKHIEEPEVIAKQSPKKVSYIGIFLDSPSKAKLISEFGIKHHGIKADHITLIMGSDPELEAMVGQRVGLNVIGYAEDDFGQAAVVELSNPSIYKVKGGIPHITISHDKSKEPKYSNELLSRGYQKVTPITLEGVIDTHPSSLGRGGR